MSRNSLSAAKFHLQTGKTNAHSISLPVPDVGGVAIHKLLVPRVVLNASMPYVILDCQYGLNHSEKDGMVLKWYLNGRTIYQWIPPAHPKVRKISTVS